MIEFTGIQDLDKIINNYKGEHNLLSENKIYEHTSWYLFRNHNKLDKIIDIESCSLNGWSKTNDGYSFSLRKHNSCGLIFSTTILYFCFLIWIGVIIITNINNNSTFLIYLFILLTFGYTLCILYLFFIKKDIILISINKDGFMFYKGTISTKLKNLKKIYYSFEDVTIKVVKKRFTWVSYGSTGWGQYIIEHTGFANIIYISKTDVTKEIQIKLFKDEIEELTDEFNQIFLSYKRYIRNLLQFSFEFISCEDEQNRQIIDAFYIRPITV